MAAVPPGLDEASATVYKRRFLWGLPFSSLPGGRTETHWPSTKGKAVCIFRRGADKAEIRDLQFSKNNTFMSVSSDHATIHLFKIDLSNAEAVGNATDEAGLDEEAKEDQKG